MAIRIIPKKTKVQMEIVKGFTLLDVLYLLVCAGVFAALIYANFPENFILRLSIAIFITTLLAVMIVKSNGVRLYSNVGWMFGFIAVKKHFYKDGKSPKAKKANVKELVPYEGIIEGDIINYKEYFAKVIEILPLEFGLLREAKQDAIINSFANAFRRLGDGQSGAIYKVTKPLILDSYLKEEARKQSAVQANFERGEMSEKELATRNKIFENRNIVMEYYNTTKKIYKDHYYFVIYDKTKSTLSSTAIGVINSLQTGQHPVQCHVCNAPEIASFLKANYGKNFDERNIENLSGGDLLSWIIPDEVKFKVTTTEIDGVSYCNFVVNKYPSVVGNAWGYSFFSLPDTKVCVNFTPIPKAKAQTIIDKAIIEVQTQLMHAAKTSEKIDKQTSLQSLQDLLVQLKSENEALFNITISLTCEAYMKKEVRAKLKELGFAYNELPFRQVEAFISSNVSRLNKLTENDRGIQTSTLAGIFPFISSALQDPKGFYIGYNQYPVFIDLFKRDSERVNSNMIVIGKTGSGKSFATKTLLTHLAADDSKVFILDPENEYEHLARNLGGKIIDVGNGNKARFNPFQVITELEDDEIGTDYEDEEKPTVDYLSTHLQFLEEYFRLILDGISADALETLNKLVVDLYWKKEITQHTDITKLKAEDFPTFDELYAFTVEKHNKEKDEYTRQNYKIVLNYIAKFATGGRNSALWNGPSNINADENFVVFSFMTLLANRNSGIAAAQMLLCFKYLENEIIKNREYNEKHNAKRKIIIAVDEAHVFINPKYPIALDFMFQMAKRIRKYGGMQIIISQNIRDFLGSEDMIRQSSAIIAASQYSMIFSLSPNDVTELVKLYKNAGEINETEQDQIANAGLGEAFFITSPMSRTEVKIDATDEIRDIFEKS